MLRLAYSTAYLFFPLLRRKERLFELTTPSHPLLPLSQHEQLKMVSSFSLHSLTLSAFCHHLLQLLSRFFFFLPCTCSLYPTLSPSLLICLMSFFLFLLPLFQTRKYLSLSCFNIPGRPRRDLHSFHQSTSDFNGRKPLLK